MKKRFGKLIIEWGFPIGNPDCPSAYRWRLDFHWFSFRIHKWVRNDDTRAYHSHPWNFFTFILSGSYLDVSPINNGSNYRVYQKMEKFSWAVRKRDYKHYVQVINVPTWTFVFTWGKYGNFGFWDTITGKYKNRHKYHIEEGHQLCDQ